MGVERKAVDDLVGGLERHVDQPIDRQHQEDDIDNGNEIALRHQFASFRIMRV